MSGWNLPPRETEIDEDEPQRIDARPTPRKRKIQPLTLRPVIRIKTE